VTFAALGCAMIAARAGAQLAAKLKLPQVLGELCAGVLLGALPFAVVRALKLDPVLEAFAELGVLLLLFEVGLESELHELARVGRRSLAVAVIGVAAPMALGVLVSRLFVPSAATEVHLFVGATLSATSVGITARVFRDLNRTQTSEAKVILGAAVIDDVLGLLLLAGVTASVRAADTGAALSWTGLALTALRALGFCAGAVIAGRWLAAPFFGLFARSSARGSLSIASVVWCALWAYAASAAGLAPAIGAFFAGLVLAPANAAPFVERERSFANEYEGGREDIGSNAGAQAFVAALGPLGAVFVPLFFVRAGAMVDLTVFAQRESLAFALALTAVAVVGKLASGLAASTRETRGWVVGVGMIPRGEVGLIFAAVGASLTLHGAPVVGRSAFAAVVAMVAITTLVTPPALARMLR
jgi:Kef-type K+ transport system membrane component KefB